MMRSRVTLARIDAAATERHVRSAFTAAIVRGWPTKSQGPSTTTPSGATPNALKARRAAPQRPQGARSPQPLRPGHPELVAFIGAGVTHRPGGTPSGDAVEEGLALPPGEQLRVADLVHPPVPRDHCGPHGARSRPGAAPDLVDTHHDFC